MLWKNIKLLNALKAHMTEEKKPVKIEFAPGCFDDFEGSQEELDSLITEIKQMFEGKTKEEIESMSNAIDLEELAMDESVSDKEFERIASIIFEDPEQRKLQ